MRKISVLTAAFCFGLSTAALAGGAQKEMRGAAGPAPGHAGSTVQTAPGAGSTVAPAPRVDPGYGSTVAPEAVPGYGGSVPPAEASAELRARARLARAGYEMVTDLKRTPWGFEGLAVREANEVKRIAIYNDGTVRSVP